MILGVDVSALQGVIDWARVAAAGVRFAYLRCTIGNEPKQNDTRFAINVKGCREAGIYPGAYHFAFPLATGAGNSPADQARRAYVQADTLGSQKGELPPSLDIEWPPPHQWAKWGVTAQSIAGWTRAYLTEAERLWGRKPVVYTYPWFWQSVLAGTDNIEWAAEYPLWMARYLSPNDWMPVKDASGPPKPWTHSAIWQFAADGSNVRIPGIGTVVDRDVFLGELSDLRRFCGIDPEAVTEPELPPCPDSTPTTAADMPTILPQPAELIEGAIAEYRKERDEEG